MNNDPAGEAPVERAVRPCALMLKHKDGHWNTLHVDALATQPEWVRAHWGTAAPLYDQAALDAAVAAERERCAQICDDEFPRLPSNAERDLCVWIAQGIRKGYAR